MKTLTLILTILLTSCSNDDAVQNECYYTASIRLSSNGHTWVRLVSYTDWQLGNKGREYQTEYEVTNKDYIASLDKEVCDLNELK